jgi:hypothetical protein
MSRPEAGWRKQEQEATENAMDGEGRNGREEAVKEH